MQKYLVVPISVFEGNVEIIEKAQIHPLNKYLLKYVCIEHNLEKIVKGFELDKRIIEETIVELMYKNLVYIDFENALIYPSSEIATVVDEGRLETYLELSFPQIVKVRWIQDNITGQICMENEVKDYYRMPINLYHDNPNLNPDERVRLNPKDYLKITNISQESLIKIGKITLREYINKGQIVEQVKRISNFHVIDNRTLYISLKTEEIHGQTYDLPYSEKIPVEVLESWGRSITHLDPYTLSDLTPLDDNFILRYDWELIMRKWDRFLTKMEALLNQNQINRKNKEDLEAILKFLEYEGSKQLLLKMREIGFKVNKVELFFQKGIQILEFLKKRIFEAKKLVIIGSAFINSDTIQSILSFITTLDNKNLKIILIWGGLGNEISNINTEISKIQNQEIIFIKGKETFHSKFLLIDNKIGWITSCNLLSYYYSDKSPTETICEFEGGLILNDIIEYAIQLIPEKIIPIQYIDSVFKINNLDDEIIKNYSEFNNFQDNLSQMADYLREFMNSSLRYDLISQIKPIFNNIKKFLGLFRNMETAVLIENLDHRKLLRSCLSEAKKKIKIASDRILQRAISPILVSDFNDAISREIKIKISWGREDPNDARKDQYESALNGRNFLFSQTKQKIILPKLPCHSHAKYLLLDSHFSLITSYNLLAFSGNGLADDEITKELGVVICSKSIANRIDQNTI